MTNLANLLQQPPALPQVGTVGSLELLGRVTRRIHERWPDITPQYAEADREALLHSILERIRDWLWDSVPMAVVCAGARYAFSKPFSKQAIFAPVRDFYLREARLNGSPTFMAAIWTAWLESYEAGSDITRQLTDVLNDAQPRLPAPTQQFLNAVPGVLCAKTAPDRLAQVMAPQDNPYDYLRRQGLRQVRSPGMMQLTHAAYVKVLAPYLEQQLWVERLLCWLGSGKNKLINGAELAIEALLHPWHNSEPSEKFSRLLAEELVNRYGDPRLSLIGPWALVSRESLDTLFRWLTRDDILFFLDVVSRSQESHMWEPRREFWRSLYDEGMISAAWVAFGRDAFELAKDYRNRGDISGAQAFGRQTARGNRTDTSLLLMRIGRCLVVEGSHNYKVHLFYADDENAPRLFEPSYDCERIRRLPGVIDSVTHYVSGFWRDKVRELLAYYA